jgi:Holliday junction resolvase RusA-like endonuclease
MFNVTDDNPQSKAWMGLVREAGWKAMSRLENQRPFSDVALEVSCTFFVKRPEGHHGTGRNVHLVKDAAPARPIVMPDTDKLARGTLDALTGVVWKDDALIVGLTLNKRYAVPVPETDGQGVMITVSAADEQTAVDLPIESRRRHVEGVYSEAAQEQPTLL